jgi:hypothetical protein
VDILSTTKRSIHSSTFYGDGIDCACIVGIAANGFFIYVVFLSNNIGSFWGGNYFHPKRSIHKPDIMSGLLRCK